PLDVGAIVTVADRIRSAIETVIEGKPEVLRITLTTLLAEGHLLIEDVPGVGKTMLAKALGRAVDCSVQRVQFTPDLLPSDITGVSVFHQDRKEFEFNPGPVFANIVLGDEINRASPKTQSALLECMEERQVSVDGRTRALESPFMVVATQTPTDMHGPRLGGLSGASGRAGHDRLTQLSFPARVAGARHRHRTDPFPDRPGTDRSRGPRDTALRRRPGQRHQNQPRVVPGCLSTCDPAPGACGPCLRRPGRTPLRGARRRPGPGRACARTPFAARPRGTDGAAHLRTDRRQDHRTAPGARAAMNPYGAAGHGAAPPPGFSYPPPREGPCARDEPSLPEVFACWSSAGSPSYQDS